MKKILAASLCLALLLTATLVSCKKKTEEVKEEKKEEEVEEEKIVVEPIPFEYDIDDGAASIEAYTGEDPEVEVPEAVTDEKTGEKVAVTAIADGAFFGNETVTSVTVPEGVISVGAGAFQNCTALESVKLPSTLETIGVRAFFNCTSLSDFAVPEKVNSIGYMAFSDFFTAIPWYASQTGTVIVGDGILLKYTGNADANFGSEVKHVAYYAFLDSSVAKATFSSSLESIDERAFFGSSTMVHLDASSAAVADANSYQINHDTYSAGAAE